MKKTKVKKEWSPHPYLVAAFRKVWYWSPERRHALSCAKIGKDQWQCRTCHNVVVKEKYVTKKGRSRTRMTGSVDHIVPIGKQPRSWSEYNEYLAKTFCSADNLQVLCKSCHSAKSKSEGKERTK
jgi:5-methylcytosine-specific restriction endonuclease McrA